MSKAPPSSSAASAPAPSMYNASLECGPVAMASRAVPGLRSPTLPCVKWASPSTWTKARRLGSTISRSGTVACSTFSTWADSPCERRWMAPRPAETTYERFDRAASELAARGGGVISIYYHPTEFVTTEFWDAVNFAKGADRERTDWRRPTETDRSRFRTLLRNTARLCRPYEEACRACGSRPRARCCSYTAGPTPRVTEPRSGIGAYGRETDVPAHGARIAFGRRHAARTARDGPAGCGRTGHAYCQHVSWRQDSPRSPGARQGGCSIVHSGEPAAARGGLDRIREAVDRRLCGHAGRLRRNLRHRRGIHRAKLEFENYFSTDPKGSFSWPIHPEGFSAPELLDLGRLQGWTLKPARLR